ncbi:MAG: transporter [Halorientalis sp.]
MAIAVTIGYVLHMLFAGIWTGGVIFMTYGVIPVGRAGNIDTDPFADITSRLLILSRTCALFLLLTGGYLASTMSDSLMGTTKGYLVIAMIVLWLAMAGLVEVGTKKISAGLRERKVRTPAEKGRPFFLGASIVALLLLVVAGALLGL